MTFFFFFAKFYYYPFHVIPSSPSSFSLLLSCSYYCWISCTLMVLFFYCLFLLSLLVRLHAKTCVSLFFIYLIRPHPITDKTTSLNTYLFPSFYHYFWCWSFWKLLCFIIHTSHSVLTWSLLPNFVTCCCFTAFTHFEK